MIIKSIFIAFSMYSKVPVPHVAWDKDSMKYALCFFPLVGAVIGAVMYGASILFSKVEGLLFLKAVIYTLIPVFISGGIHLDGYLDTADALCSWADREKKLKIMKDSNSGAFAIIFGLAWLALSVAVWYEMNDEMIKIACFGYVLSRALSGLSVAGFKKAKNTGLAVAFADTAHKRIVCAVMTIYIMVTVFAMCYINPVMGSAASIASLVTYGFHYYNCRHNFGGITGDLAGYFLVITELVIPLSCVICGVII